jgi:hypothetical protein
MTTALYHPIGIRGFAISNVTNLYPLELPITDSSMITFLHVLALLTQLRVHMTITPRPWPYLLSRLLLLEFRHL